MQFEIHMNPIYSPDSRDGNAKAKKRPRFGTHTRKTKENLPFTTRGKT